MTRVTLLWCGPNGDVRKATFEARPFYIGRHPNPTSDLNPLSVYVVDAKTREVLAAIGGEYPTVSRLHALVEVRGDKIIVRDHGPYGGRSKNGTFINGRPIPPGGWLEARGWSVVGLASTGPRILIVVEGSKAPFHAMELEELIDVPECLKGKARDIVLEAQLEPEKPAKSLARGVEECYVLAIAGWRLKDLVTAQVDAGELAARAKKLLEIVRGNEWLFKQILKADVESFKAALTIVKEHGYAGLRSVSTTLRTFEAILREASEARCSRYLEEVV